MEQEVLARRLKDARQRRGLSHGRLHLLSGVGAQSLINIEIHGQVPKADTLHAVALALGVSADYLLGLTDDPRPAYELAGQLDEMMLLCGDLL